MKIVSGTAKGRELRYPRGTKTRPTSDKVRDAIFNVLGDLISGSVVLDLYAGSGAMAIEALSRGAERVEVVESDREACAAIRQNLDLTGFTDLCTIWPMPVERTLPKLGTRFDMVLADPPYLFEGIHALMDALGTGELLSCDAVVVLEHGKRFEPQGTYGNLVRWQEKRYGDAVVSLYEVQAST